MSSAAKASGNAAQTPKAVSPLAHLSLSDLAALIRLPPLRGRKFRSGDACAPWVANSWGRAVLRVMAFGIQGAWRRSRPVRIGLFGGERGIRTLDTGLIRITP